MSPLPRKRKGRAFGRDTIRLTVDVSPEMHEHMKAAANADGKFLKEFCSDGLEHWTYSHHKLTLQHVKKRLDLGDD